MSSLKKLLFILILATLSSVGAVLMGAGGKDASAQVINYEQAVQTIGSHCAQGYVIAHSAYGYNPRLDMNSGVVTYDLAVLWQRCNWTPTGEYAITGYNGNACPAVGYYHSGWNGTQDCIKYTDRHGEGRSAGVCGSPSCVFPGFNANIRKGGRTGPPDVGVLRGQYIGSRTVAIPNWSSVRNNSGEATVYVATLCGAHFRDGGGWSNWGDLYCQDTFVHVSWKRPWSVTPSSTADMTTAAPGQTITWTHRVTNDGPDPTGAVVNYRYQNSSGLGAGSGPNNTLASGTSSGGSATATSTHTVIAADLGKTLCRATSANPRSHDNSATVVSSGACVTIPFNYTLIPTITNVPDGSPIESDGKPRDIIGNIKNDGSTKSRPNVDWQLTQVIYQPSVGLGDITNKSGGTGVVPCSFFTGGDCSVMSPNGSGTEAKGFDKGGDKPYASLATIADEPVGTKVCFAMSVRQYNQTADDWSHSALHCFVVAKKPKVQILGGDLLVGRTLAGVTKPSTSLGIVAASVSSNSAGVFGSWGEYGIAATGLIKDMSSGSGNAGGSALNVNLLTFANVGPMGNFSTGSSMPSVASRFKSTGLPQLTSPTSAISLTNVDSGVYGSTANGTLRLAASNLGLGKSIVINAPNTDVVIEGDIQYFPGDITRSVQIPQLVIIARNITINSGVSVVDSWLVANGLPQSDGTIAHGVIKTCQLVSSAVNSRSCDNKLTINGPVIANKLLMLRTAGAGTGASAGDPAEVFNLRPDAYLWAMNQDLSGGRAATVMTKELPPRY